MPQQIAGGDIYPALERGTIDAAEWVGPYDDEKLGFQKVAPFYYYPGFWEGSAHVCILLQHGEMERAAEALQGHRPGGRRLRAHATCRPNTTPATRRPCGGWSARARSCGRSAQEIMEARYKAANELYDEISGKNADFKKVYDSMRAFRNEEYLWFQVAEYTFDNFMIRARARG